MHDKNVILENFILKEKISAALLAGNKSLELLTSVQKYKVDSKLISDYYPQGKVLVQIIPVSE